MIPVPCSPSPPLSGSACETELRIRSIFQWKKQRPPLWAMVLIAAPCPLLAADWPPVRCRAGHSPAAPPPWQVPPSL